MTPIADFDSLRAHMQSVRRDIHAHPELGFEEERTSEIVARELAAYGIDIYRGLGRTGVVGTLRSGRSNATIGLRADMDALPITEANRFVHASQNAGRMHACGHDGHVAMLLGAASWLARYRTFDGTVHFIFQPAEEGRGGACAMIKDGLFERFPCDAVFGLHNWPAIPAGAFGARVGPLLASSNEFHITVRGKGSHAAMPQDGNDPIFAAAQIVSGLQSVITRNKRPLDVAVLSITQIHAGEALNAYPDEATIAGTVRTYHDNVLDLVESRMRQIAESTAAAYDCRVQFHFSRKYPATVNTRAETALALDVMAGLVGEENVAREFDPVMAAEDFSFMLREKPGCYAFIGNGSGDHREAGHGLGPCALHNGSYDFNDDILVLGARYWVRLVERFFAHPQK